MDYKQYGVVLFGSTHAAITMEAYVKQQGLAARIVPTPEKLQAACGFSLRYELTEEKAVKALLAEHKVAYEGLYHARGQRWAIEYEKV